MGRIYTSITERGELLKRNCRVGKKKEKRKREKASAV
jgi:hypothetical protein